jgi:hypothetical protein
VIQDVQRTCLSSGRPSGALRRLRHPLRGHLRRNAFWNPGDEPVRFLELITPGGFEEYFAELEPILGVAGPPHIPGLMAVQARYALSMDMASMPLLIAEHGLADLAA